MKVTDMLAPKIRPHTFMLPNTDAGGGVGYDDMLPEHYNNLSKPQGMYACKCTYSDSSSRPSISSVSRKPLC